MSETTKILETELGSEVVAEKPYTFRKLSSVDVFPMFKIIGKIGLKEFTAAIDKDAMNELIAAYSAEQRNGEKDNSFGSWAVHGASVILGVADVIFSKLPYCESEIFQLLSQTSNLSVDEVKGLDFATFAEMVIDFIKKEEFKDFIKVASRLFK